MGSNTVYVYINPTADVDSYPRDLHGDMSVFWNARCMQHEVQWVLYLLLKDQGLDVQYCQHYPDEGILLILKEDATKFVWKPGLYVISLQYDYKRDDRAQMHIVSNDFKSKRAALSWLDRMCLPGPRYYVPSVMHTDVTPRNASRGDKFESIVFIGAAKNLDNAFKTDGFLDGVKALGMRFSIVDDPRIQSDYSEVDVVMAIRKIGHVIANKPPVKLINAWRGEVPAILGREIGFQEARESEYDFIEVDSLDETLAALNRLKNDVELRRKMVANGKTRAIPYSTDGQRDIWIKFVHEIALPANESWQRKSLLYQCGFLGVRWLRYLLRESLSFVWHRILRQGHRDYTYSGSARSN